MALFPALSVAEYSFWWMPQCSNVPGLIKFSILGNASKLSLNVGMLHITLTGFLEVNKVKLLGHESTLGFSASIKSKENCL